LQLPDDYADRVYAGVLGKVIGVYLGRPFEGWTYERIQERLGDITHYVHEELGVPLIVTDDDISGTFTFLRALGDHGFDKHISSEQIGDSWLNYLIENRTILWWGGLGNSTEHTAFLRLKNGVRAPASGSAKLNGKVVAEQIGAQIFIDGWAMVSPGDADQAARLATEAARVSHDGEAVHGAVVLAVMEALAFVESDIDKLLDAALEYVPSDSVIRMLIDDVRSWHAQESDWRATREMLAGKYGYDKYGGNCHMVPNHGLIIHSLLHGEDDFSETMKIINTCGWDTDCNSGNVGCLMGIKNGLGGIDSGLERDIDWRGPVADRIYIPTADPSWGVTDCASEAVEIINAGRALADEAAWHPKGGAQFHFALPGSVQGFMATSGAGEVANVELDGGDRALRVSAASAGRFGSPVFAPSKDVAKRFEKVGYALLASPRLYPGQTVTARLQGGDSPTDVCLYVAFYGEDDQPTFVRSDTVNLTPGASVEASLSVPGDAQPVFEVGVELPSGGNVLVDSIGWEGEPDVVLTRPDHGGSMWRRAWVNGVDSLGAWGEPYRIIQNDGRGLVTQGTRQWRNYSVAADVTPHLVTCAGVAAHVQGMRRYYALLVHRDQEVHLVRMRDTETVLARAPLNWSLGDTLDLELSISGEKLTGSVNGKVLVKAEDGSIPSGGVALVVEDGRTATQSVRVQPT
jgi:ADP-ribosylglycohydrolase